jgi:hypothetical protein
MRIQSSDVFLSSESSKAETYFKNENLRYWVGNEINANGQELSNSLPKLSDMKDYLLDISDEARKKLNQQVKSLSLCQQSTDDDSDITSIEELKAKMLEEFIKALTGKRIKLLHLDDKLLKNLKNPGIIQSSTNTGSVRTGAGWGLAYNSTETYTETEKISFSSSGIIKTSDGRNIEFGLKLNVSREFISQKSIDIRAGDALCDPLVINFSAPSASLENTKFSFDLDANGTLDQISFLKQGSGFLALDKNNDGRINDGSELFGPQSGNGFSDLAQYDSDKNNWIDENDPIYEKLRIWTKDKDGNDSLFALGQKGIGAIYLGNVGTQFDLKDQQNNRQGRISKTGVFLNENGTAGTIQHVDLAL